MTENQYILQGLVMACAILGGAGGYALSMIITPRRTSNKLAAFIVVFYIVAGVMTCETALIYFIASTT